MDISTSKNINISSSTSSATIVPPDIKNKKRIRIVNEIGNYFNCNLSKKYLGAD